MCDTPRTVKVKQRWEQPASVRIRTINADSVMEVRWLLATRKH